MCIRITGIVEREMLSMQVLLPTHLVEKINPNQRSYLHTLSQNRHPNQCISSSSTAYSATPAAAMQLRLDLDLELESCCSPSCWKVQYSSRF